MAELGWMIFVGVGATLAMDLWALLLRGSLGIASLDYAWVGRWIGHMARGRFTHDRIAAASPVARERLLGWTAHYAIGVAFAGTLLLVAGTDWARQPTPWPAIATGVASLAAPFLIMQPAFGLGVAAARLPHPNVARFRSLLTHLIFGAGLYGSALIFASMFPQHFSENKPQILSMERAFDDGPSRNAARTRF